jgi:MFS family permease
VIEQYDFLVTGVIAATVWGGVFFKLPGLAAIAAAIGVYGIGILVRPIGAYIFGHIADRRGRKDALVYALVLMGVSTLLIGLTPTYDSIGIAAPALLIVFRLVQGVSFGAEFGRGLGEKKRRKREAALVWPTAARKSAWSAGVRARMCTRRPARSGSIVEYLAACGTRRSSPAICSVGSLPVRLRSAGALPYPGNPWPGRGSSQRRP